jgi:hypothetical protein
MSSREFFKRFPSLYTMLHDKLVECINDLERRVVNPLLYPIMTLLSKRNFELTSGTKSG